MKRFIAAALIGFSAVACFAEEECESAVDLADSMDVNTQHDCGQGKTGLNRLVHKMFNRDSAESAATSPVADAAAETGKSQTTSLVSNASELAAARYQLLLAIGKQCTGGFRLIGEQYLPSEEGLRVKLLYECL